MNTENLDVIEVCGWSDVIASGNHQGGQSVLAGARSLSAPPQGPWRSLIDPSAPSQRSSSPVGAR